MHKLDFIFFGFRGRISANTTGLHSIILITPAHTQPHAFTTTCVVYNLVIMEAIDGLSSETKVQLFYKYKTTDYRLLWDKAQSDYKDHKLKALTWKKIRKSVE